MDERRLIKEIKLLRWKQGNIHSFRAELENSDFSKYNLRWLISISDTFCDEGTEVERFIAQSISNFCWGVRLSDTISYPEIKESEVLNGEIRKLYDGMETINIKGGDTTPNLLWRMRRITEKSELMDRLWSEILLRLKTHSPSLIRHNKNRNNGSAFRESYYGKN